MSMDMTDAELALMLVAAVSEYSSDLAASEARPAAGRPEEGVTLDEAIDSMLAPEARHTAIDRAARSLRRAQEIVDRLDGLPEQKRLAALSGAVEWARQCKELVESLSRPESLRSRTR